MYKIMSVKILRTHTDVSFNTKNDNGGVCRDPCDAHNEEEEEDGDHAWA